MVNLKGAKVDHFLNLPSGDEITPVTRRVITKLLIVEEDKLSHNLEHLEFAETTAANGRERVNRVRNLCKTFAFGTPERECAERLLVNVENLQTMLDGFCHRLREQINTRGII